MQTKPRYLQAGESALVVEFGTIIDPKIHDRVLALDAAIEKAGFDGITETVPTYRSLMIHFEPRKWALEALIDAVAELPCEPAPRLGRRRWNIPACYDPPHCEDLVEAAAVLKLAPERLVSLHIGAVYRVYMYGFAPGYVFLGGLAPELSLPRRSAPRRPAPEGSLLIAGGQALIASCAMPTGWYLIGRTPVKMLDPGRAPGFFINAGDEVRFARIDLASFEALRLKTQAGELVAAAECLEET